MVKQLVVLKNHANFLADFDPVFVVLIDLFAGYLYLPAVKGLKAVYAAPQPEGPRITTTSPFLTLRLIPFKTCKSP